MEIQFNSVNRVRLPVTPWTVACQASLSITNSQSLLRLISIEKAMADHFSILALRTHEQYEKAKWKLVPLKTIVLPTNNERNEAQ